MSSRANDDSQASRLVVDDLALTCADAGPHFSLSCRRPGIMPLELHLGGV
jgi:hypothetical protein